MFESVRLCEIGSVKEGSPFRVLVEGYPPLAVFKLDGDYYVTADTCTHGQASLCDGYQEREKIECPYHGGAFDIRTGEPVAFPCNEPLAIYEAKVVGEFVCLTAR